MRVQMQGWSKPMASEADAQREFDIANAMAALVRDNPELAPPADRITSYNVCYTKLLRLVGGEQEGERAGMLGIACDKGFDRGDGGGNAGLHVGGATAVEDAVSYNFV